jgi:hypothetical protein
MMQRKFSCVPAALGLITLVSGCGIANQSESGMRYSARAHVETVQTAARGGDFGLFYAGEEKTQVPVRVNAGDPIGFIRNDGRLQGVAGPFKIDIPATVHDATWKRLKYTPEGYVPA